MCSRFSRTSLIKALQHRFLFQDPEQDFPPEYNIAPTDEALVVVQEGDKRVLKRMMFGLVPHWAKDIKMGLHCLNARAETVVEKPSFREPIKNRRCLVLSDGFYEWKVDGKKKFPYRFTLKTHEPFALAGLWDKWTSPHGKTFESFAIVTTEPNSLVATLHDRMPVILKNKDESLWLNPQITDTNIIRPLLTGYPPDEMEYTAVSTYVSNSSNKGPESIAPFSSSPTQNNLL